MVDVVTLGEYRHLVDDTHPDVVIEEFVRDLDAAVVELLAGGGGVHRL